MKFYFSCQQKINSDWRHRCVWMTGSTGGERSESALEEKELDKILRSPYSFDASSIKKLEELDKDKKLESRHQRRIGQIAQFHLSLIGSRSDINFPSRVLFELQNSELWKYLNPGLKNNIKALFSTETKKAENYISKSVNALSPSELTRMTGLYRFMRTSNNKNTDTFQKLADKLLEKTQSIINAHEVFQETDEIFAENLSARDKLFILEVQDLFPEKIQLQKIDKSNVLKKIGDSVIFELERDLKSDNFKNKLEYLPLWEVLNGLKFHNLSTKASRNLEAMIKQSQAAQFMGWIESWKNSPGGFVLLPEHIRALQDIKKDAKNQEGQENIKRVIGDFDSSVEGKKEFEKFLIDWEDKNGTFYREEQSSSGDKKRIKINLAEARKAFERNYESKDKVIEAFEKTKTELKKNSIIKRLYEIEGFKTKWDSILYEGNIEGLKNDLEPTPGSNDKPSDILRDKIDFKSIREFLKNDLEKDKFAEDEIAETRSLLNGFEKSPVGQEFESKKNQAERKIEEDIKYVSGKQDALSKHVKMARQLFYKGENSEKALELYKDGLKDRATNRRLQSADLSVLYEKQDSEIDSDFKVFLDKCLKDEVSSKILEFRKKFEKTIIKPLLNDASSNSLNNPENFTEWLKRLDDNAIFKEDELKDILEELKVLLAIGENNNSMASSLTIKEILDSTRASFTDKILDAISPLFDQEVKDKIKNVLGKNKEEELNDFIAYYERNHQALYDLDQDHKNKVFEKYVNEKSSFDRFEDGLKQRNNEAVGGVSRDYIIDYIHRKTGISKEKIEEGFNSFSPEDLKNSVKSILEGDLSSVKKILNKIPDLTDILSNASKEEKEKFIFNIGRLIAREGTNQDFNEVVKGQTNFLVNGEDVGDEDEKNPFPGFETMNDMSLQLSPLSQEVQNLHVRFEGKIKRIINRISGGSSGSKMSFKDLEQELFSDWDDNIKPRLNYIKDDAKVLLNNLFPNQKGKFNKIFIDGFEDKINFFQIYINEFRKSYNGKDLEGEASARDLDNLLTGFADIPLSFDIDKGDFHEIQANASESLRHVPNTLEFINDELRMLEPGGKEKAKKNFEALRKKYKPIIDTYIARAEKSGKRMEYDLKKLDDTRFKHVYGMDKKKGQQHLENLKASSFNFLSNFSGQDELASFESRTGWNNTESEPQTNLGKTGFFQKDFFEKWYTEYASGDVDRMGESISDMNVFSGMVNDKYMKDVKKQNNELHKFDKEYSDFIKKNPQWRTDKIEFLVGAPLRLWNGFNSISWNWFSVMDIYQMGVDFMEVWEREKKKVQEQAVANLGSSIFGNSGIGKEFARRAEEAEETRVKEYKQRMEDQPQDAWWGVLYRTNNQDEARAMMDLLSEAGQLRWDDPGLLRTLNRLQNRVKFNVPDDINNRSYSDLSDMIEQACLSPWSKKVFDGWDKSQKGNFKKGLEQHDKKFGNLVEEGGIKDELGSMLERWENGDETVDPLAFANYLYQAFKGGEINGPSDPRWFYLIVGARLKNPAGKTLLPKDFFIFMKGELRPEIPHFDFFTENSANHWMKGGRLVPPGTPGGHPASESWNEDDRQAWVDFLTAGVSSFTDTEAISRRSVEFFYQFVTTSPKARIRLDKQGRKLGQDSDHDDAWMQSAGISYNNMTQALNKISAGGDIMSQEWALSFLDGFPRAIESLYLEISASEAIYGDVPGWEEAKNQKLLEIGERIRIGFIASQTLAGNVHDNTSTFPMVLNLSQWNDPNSTAHQARNTLTDMVGGILSGEVEDFHQVKGWLGIQQNSSGNYKEIKALSGFPSVNRAILAARSSDSFKDPLKIEAMLKKQIGLSGSSISGGKTRSWDSKNTQDKTI